MAELLNFPENQIASRLLRAKARLKNLLEKEGGL
jgi:DNA-directed RNA polymerase specialized sigma24 family protein